MTDKYYRLASDKLSTFNKGYVYGLKGEKVKLITGNNGVMIVEGTKERFSIHSNQLIPVS